MAITQVGTDQVFTFADGNSPGHSCAFGSSPSAGDLDILFVGSDTTVNTPSGFTAGPSRVNNMGAYIFYRKAAGGESGTVAVVTNGNNNTVVIWQRWSGTDAFDGSASTGADAVSGNATPTGTTGTLSASGELAVAMGALSNIGGAAQTSPTWSSSYVAGTTGVQGLAGSGVRVYSASKNGVGTAATSTDVTWSGDAATNRYTLIATFTAAAGGGSIDGTITAAGDATTASLTGSIDQPGTITASSDATTASLTGTIDIPGTITAVGDATTAVLSGTSPIDGTITASSGVTTASLTGTGPVAGAASTAFSRRLARLWFRELIGIERYLGDGAYGPFFDTEISAAAAVDHGTKEVLTPTGDSTISTARVFLAVDTDTVPLGSRVTLPDAHGGGSFIVITANLHRSGQPTPDHLELSLQ